MSAGEDCRGTLFLVATPIGNLSDLSVRARETLSSCDSIVCEDTRVTGKLLDHLSLCKPMVSYREENERKRTPELANALQQGQTLALVSDAGYPGISDPGFRLVRECSSRGIRVVPVPGPNAAITALAASGLPTHQFLFLGLTKLHASFLVGTVSEVRELNREGSSKGEFTLVIGPQGYVL